MRPVLAALALLLAAPAAAPASDAQINYVLHREAAAVKRLLDGAAQGDELRRFAHGAPRIARRARRAGRLVSHLVPSTRNGAIARRQAVMAFREVRVGARVLLLALGTPGRAGDHLIELASARMFNGILALANAETLLHEG